MRTVSGGAVRARAKPVHACRKCGGMAGMNASTGDECRSCGGRIERFDSMAELRRWNELLLLEKAGEISRLERQVRIHLIADGGVKVCDYIADHRYLEDGTIVIEDVKGGAITDVSKLKIKFLKAMWSGPGREVRIINR